MATLTDMRPAAAWQKHVPAPDRRPSSFGLRRMLTASRATRTAAWTSRPAPARRCSPTVQQGDRYGRQFLQRTDWLDHGGGLLTVYCHLSCFDLKVGDAIKTGETLAA
ncbi:M23 family metallopeptidase [Variovorax sp. V15]|uniref:M23 family metallopeptidase n=1 Tax=Variovorax sp. V15 TaxID=3065952 RepID=UPI0034E8B62D